MFQGSADSKTLIRQVIIFQESARNRFREAGIVMQSYTVEIVHQPFRNNSCLVCTPGNDFYINYRFFDFCAWGVHTRLVISPMLLILDH